jgi:hypothetical protein
MQQNKSLPGRGNDRHVELPGREPSRSQHGKQEQCDQCAQAFSLDARYEKPSKIQKSN